MRRWVPLCTAVLLLAALPTAADDPNPPEMGAATIERQVYSPGELVNVTIEWIDDSGMDQVYLYGYGPNHLSLNEGPNPEGRYGHGCSDPQGRRVVTVTCIVTLHERAPAGTYSLTQVTGIDVIGHSTVIDPQLTFTVDSPYSDIHPPQITAFSMHIDELLLKPGGGLTASVPDAMRITATDETGLRGGGAGFQGPGGNNGLWVQCERFITHDTLTCDLHAFHDIPGGDYVLQQVGVSDTIGYDGGFSVGPWRDNRPLHELIDPAPVVRVISNATDQAPPVLTGVTFPDRVHRGEEFTVYLNWTDETGITDAGLLWRTTRGNAEHRAQVSPGIWSSDDLVPCEGTWGPDVRLQCTVAFPANYPLGLAQLLFVYSRDAAHNGRHYIPIEWQWVGAHTFQDDDAHDVALIITPRPLEGPIEAIDAVVNELMPGEVAEIVYHVEDTVDEVVLRLENDVGDVIEAACSATTRLELGRTCHVPMPAQAHGVFSLKEAEVTTDDVPECVVFEDPVPVLAVAQAIPLDAYAAVPSAGGLYGAANSVGRQWLERSAVVTEQDPVWAAPPPESKHDEALPPQNTTSGERLFDASRTEDAPRPPVTIMENASSPIDDPRRVASQEPATRSTHSVPGPSAVAAIALALVARPRGAASRPSKEEVCQTMQCSDVLRRDEEQGP